MIRSWSSRRKKLRVGAVLAAVLAVSGVGLVEPLPALAADTSTTAPGAGDAGGPGSAGHDDVPGPNGDARYVRFRVCANATARPRKNRTIPNLLSNFFVISMPNGRKLQQRKMSSRQSLTIRMTRSCFLQTQPPQRRRRRFEMRGKTCSPARASSLLGSRPECNWRSPVIWGG